VLKYDTRLLLILHKNFEAWDAIIKLIIETINNLAGLYIVKTDLIQLKMTLTD
jgi:hypothetical protein